jgi:Leucine-rich repeat (LRR) protein
MKFSAILLILIQFPLHAQCDPEYTYFDTIPDNVNIINGDSCFYTSDINVLNALINDNDLDYNSPLELGTQTWFSGRLKILVAGNYGNSSGVNDTIFTLPDSIGNWDQLSSLYLEWNRIESLPESFNQLTNLQSFYISNNQLQYLPNDFGNLTILYLLDIGYNELDSLPESFCDLSGLTYLWAFNNTLSSVPACICSLDINWNDMDAAWYPYFAIGGNQLCDDVPECVANSEHFHTSLDQFYYSFMVVDSQDCDAAAVGGDLIIPEKIHLFNPYPNPFNPTTTIRLSVVARQASLLQIYDVTGRLVETFINETLEPGTYEIIWDARSHPAGIYFIQMTAGRNRQVQKLILLK